MEVMHAIQLLRRHHVEFNILSVLSRQLAKEPKKLYAFYKEHGFSHVQLIPCLAPLQEAQNTYSLTPELFYQFYRSYFDCWIQDVQ
ncbi:radical SAM/SPASM domain-containing protein, partial [Erysipelatoclostridium ramosum]|nr:radical SAM/SPASM domain-containing protein [Thomasclavelia ramosa]